MSELGIPEQEARAILLPGGKLLMAGSSDGNFVVVRLNANGSLDNTFGVNNSGRQNIDLGGQEVAKAIAYPRHNRQDHCHGL